MKLRRNIKPAASRHRLEKPQHRINIFRRIEWIAVLDVTVLRFALCTLCILFLQVRGILQGNRRQFNRRWIRVNRSFVAIAHQARQPARVVEVRMRQHTIVDRLRMHRQRLEVPSAQLRRPLKNSAIQQQFFPRCLHQIFRARDCSCRSQKRQFCHRCLSDFPERPYPIRSRKQNERAFRPPNTTSCLRKNSPLIFACWKKALKCASYSQSLFLFALLRRPFCQAVLHFRSRMPALFTSSLPWLTICIRESFRLALDSAMDKMPPGIFTGEPRLALKPSSKPVQSGGSLSAVPPNNRPSWSVVSSTTQVLK